MFRNNCTSLKIRYVVIISAIILVMFLTGSFASKKYDFYILGIFKEKNVVVKEKDIKKDVEDVLVAYSDSIDFEIKAATIEEKLTSRAMSSRRSRGELENYVPVSSVTISKTMDLNQKTGLSRADFITLISNCSADTSGFFEENAGVIYDLCQIYNINEIFFCGLISAESGWQIAQNHRNTHNYISLMSSKGGLIQFDSVYSGLEAAASALHNNYLTPGGRFYRGSTLEGVRTIFCPVNPGWTDLVYGRMCQII